MKLTKKIMCQLCLALIFSSLAASVYAASVAPGPICRVRAKVLSLNSGKAIIKVIDEKKIGDGFDKGWQCTFRRAPTVTIMLEDDDYKKLSANASISASIQQGGDENGLWVAAVNVVVLNR